MRLTVGELALRAGLTVRTLHHYDEAGLLKASGRSAAGYRLYGQADIERLNRIQLYKQMGLPLKEIRTLLGIGEVPLAEILKRQVHLLTAQIARQSRVLMRLEHLAERVNSDASCDLEELLQVMNGMNVSEKYFDEAELAAFDRRRLDLGTERIKAIQSAWQKLLFDVQQAKDAGVACDSPEAHALAQRWLALTHEFTGNDPALIEKLAVMYQQEPGLQQETGITLEIQHYIYPAIMSWRASNEKEAQG